MGPAATARDERLRLLELVAHERLLLAGAEAAPVHHDGAPWRVLAKRRVWAGGGIKTEAATKTGSLLER